MKFDDLIRLLRGQEHTCPPWACFTFDNYFRKIFQAPFKILAGHAGPGNTVLDLGPGYGYYTFPLSEIVGARGLVCAADIQKNMLDAIRNKAEKLGIKNIRYILIKKGTIDTPDRFDFILMFWMFHEVSDKSGYLAQLKKLLKENGRILLAEPIFHVTGKSFNKEEEELMKAGFEICGRPGIAFSRAVLLRDRKDG